MDVWVRDAVLDDVPQIAEIYARSVRTETASFELVPPTVDELTLRWRSLVDDGYPYLVAQGTERAVVGYCYASAYRPRPAYRRTVENSVYVTADCRRRGIASTLLTALIAACRAREFEQMVAIISDPAQSGSVALHASLGFRDVGTLHSVGWKFDRAIDVALMQLEL